MPPPPAGARCGQHPEKPAVDVCQRCGIFVCGECTEIRDEEVYCTRCGPLVGRPATRRSKVVCFVTVPWAVVLAVVVAFALRGHHASLFEAGLWLVTPVEWVGLLVAFVLELQAHRSGQAGPKGRGYLWAAGVALVVQLLLLAPLAFFYFARLRS